MVYNDCRKIRSNRMNSFQKNEKVEKWLFFGQFWANIGCFPHPNYTILMSLRTQEIPLLGVE